MKQIESIKNPRIKEWKKLQTRKGRTKAGRFLIEGEHLIEEAEKAGIEIETLLVTERERMVEVTCEERILINRAVLNELTETESPQGIIAVCKMKEKPKENEVKGNYLFVDRVQDPGNLGTIIRTADSVGMSAVILGEGTVDCYNSKVIRASQGSIFHLHLYEGPLSEWIEKLKKHDYMIYGTALEGAIPYEKVKKQARFALIMGNEGEGVAKDLLKKTDANLYIPIYGKAESLNVAVATGILLYHLRD